MDVTDTAIFLKSILIINIQEKNNLKQLKSHGLFVKQLKLFPFSNQIPLRIAIKNSEIHEKFIFFHTEIKTSTHFTSIITVKTTPKRELLYLQKGLLKLQGVLNIPL